MRNHKPKSALIVEDDALIAMATENVVRSEGFDRIEVCPSAQAAVECLATLAPDLLILDAGLADRNDGWMIAELGKIKDSGLHVVAVKEALQQTTELSDAEAYKKAYQLLGTKQPKMEQLLTEAAGICKVYFNEHNLENLVLGMGAIK